MVYELLIQNKEILKLIYALIVISICLFIVYKTNKLFKLSSHQGIRYLRNSFFFFALAFIARYFFGTFSQNFPKFYAISTKFFFEFFIIMAGFFLLYSLLCKKIHKTKNYSSIFNKGISIFYSLTFIILLLDIIWKTSFFMFASQILTFFCATIISFMNYRKKGKKHKFLKFYFIAMLLSFTAWSLNAFVVLFFQLGREMMVNIYAINIFIFLLFLYGIIKVTK